MGAVNRILIVLLLLTESTVSFAHVYRLPMGNESWQLFESPLHCRMWQSLPDYGDVIFSQRAHQAVFRIKSYQINASTGQAEVIVVSPSWKHPRTSHRYIITPKLLGNSPVRLMNEQAIGVMNQLQQGNDIQVSYRDGEVFQDSLYVSTLRFKQSYQRYLQCVNNMVPDSFDDVSRMRLHYETNQAKLSDSQEQQLMRIVRYVKADPSIKKVLIRGHSDGLAANRYNLKISLARATIVENFFLENGLKPKDLDSKGLGRDDPIAPDNTEEGRALNRRVDIILVRG